MQIDLAKFGPTAPDFKDKIQANSHADTIVYCEPREFWYWVGKKEKDGIALVVNHVVECTVIQWWRCNKGGGGGHERATESLRCGIIALGDAVYSSVNLSSAPSP